MRRPLLVGLALVLALGACGSRLNPLNWFGGSEPAPATLAPTDLPATAPDARPLMAQVISLEVEPNRGGAVVRAVGVPPTQGFWNAELVARPVQDGVMTYEFRALPPPRGAAVGTQASREVTVGTYLTAYQLRSISQITVVSAGNALTSRR
ncbi:hypothetical protein RSWS8N_00085 [Cereibacter sphaeroides WS8N]|uniref:hypothetical protein n=1 Tax=Cereibacter sphaeroides TaxID=1063 RepID=UPI00020DF1F4|nr:hypothetical protein [Cereibacter sphaeroides]EGJ20429.1 hypothetical protein RSWS8N_00085 [Cereibacter sphaeroides WS8N]SNT38835.1 hypothetical protein SAMN05421763_11371 [[Luteovulum] sphaeroides subsp. megalophilum]